MPPIVNCWKLISCSGLTATVHCSHNGITDSGGAASMEESTSEVEKKLKTLNSLEDISVLALVKSI